LKADQRDTMKESGTDIAYQQSILPKVSRTFALTIPQLPDDLSLVVGNAYLLCRIADTIEDDPILDYAAKTRLLDDFIRVLRHRRNPNDFAAEASSLLAPTEPDSEFKLVANTPRVVRVTFSFSPTQQHSLLRCVEVMARGMPEFQNQASLQGLEDLKDMSRYCYFVAGIVGEMLTELFCEYSPRLADRRNEMMSLAVSFGQSLQMTNILKDIWQDRDRGACWLPRSHFSYMDKTLADALVSDDAGQMSAGINELVGVAHCHLQRALEYTCAIPRREAGVRKFCLLAIGLATLTLRNIYRNPGYTDGNQVKVSRPVVKATILACNVSLYSNAALRVLFYMATRGMPLAADTIVTSESFKRRAEPCIDPEHAPTAPTRQS